MSNYFRIIVEYDHDYDNFVAQITEANLNASGDTVAEALLSLCDTMLMAKRTCQKYEGSLSNAMQTQHRFLDAFPGTSIVAMPTEDRKDEP